MAQPIYLTRRQAAERLGLSLSTIQRYTLSGRLRAIKLAPGRNGAVRFDPADIQAFLDNCPDAAHEVAANNWPSHRTDLTAEGQEAGR